MDLVFRALIVAVVVAGLLHTMETQYRAKQKQRRRDEISKRRLKVSAWRDLD
jgi:hypothetical protein